MRQQHLRLDLDQRRRHEDELAAQVDVQLFGLAEIVQVLVGDLRYRDVVDADLLLADQIEQQINRAGVLFQFDVER